MPKATSAQVRKIVRARLGGLKYSDKTKYGRRMSWYPRSYGNPGASDAACKQAAHVLSKFSNVRVEDRFRTRYSIPMFRVSVIEK